MNASPDPVMAPDLADLFTQYLHQQAVAQQQGFGIVDLSGEVVPHEAVPVQALDPALAWHEALAVGECFGGSLPNPARLVPADWASLVASLEPLVAVPFCFGNFPQLVRNLTPLLHPEKWGVPRRVSTFPTISALFDWAERGMAAPEHAHRLLVIGVLRLAGQFEAASTFLERLRGDIPRHWRAALANEEAALAWHRGQLEEAARLWQAQDDNIPALFNRGMAALFLGGPVEAQPALQRAAAAIPEPSGWHHLAQLYLAVATEK